MLLFVTADDPSFFPKAAASWPELAKARKHPRSGEPLVPAITRFDLFLGAFAPAPTGSGIHVPPKESWWQWPLGLRRPLRELIRSTFPPGPRFGKALDAVGPLTNKPSPEETKHLRTLTAELKSDPAQRPFDPRLWLVLAPTLPEELETVFLATFLRAEPYARIARSPSSLEGEVDELLAGKGLATRGLVANLEGDGILKLTNDDAGRFTGSSDLFDLASGLEDMYATREVLEAGEVYNRIHSHTGSEELYIVLEGEGKIRVNERLVPIRAGQCFGKPRGYDCNTQIVNSGTTRMVFLDVGTSDHSEVDLCRYPEHGEVLARFAGHRWFVPTDALQPGPQLFQVYENRYQRKSP